MARAKGIVKYLVLCALLAGAGVFWFFQSRGEIEAVQRPDPPVVVARPVQGDLHHAITLGGHIASETTVTVLPRVSGMIQRLYVESGDTLAKGDLIAEIDPEVLDLQVRQAEAAYRSAKSAYERTSRLYESRSATLQDYNHARSQFEAYEAQYHLAQLQLNYAAVTAPIDGVVLMRHSSEGALVSPEVPIITIGSEDQLKITSRLPERHYDIFSAMLDEMQVRVSRPGGDTGQHHLEAQITRIAPFITAETRKFEVVSRMTGTTGQLRPGMYVNVTYVLEELIDVFCLPIEAYVAGGYVWYVDEQTSRAQRIALETPFMTEERFSIPDAYQQYQFILEGQHFLQEGQRVRIIGKREL